MCNFSSVLFRLLIKKNSIDNSIPMNTEIYVIYQDWNGTKPQKHAEEIQQPEN